MMHRADACADFDQRERSASQLHHEANVAQSMKQRQEATRRKQHEHESPHVLKGALAAGVATSALKVPAAVAQAGPIKVGFLTIKTGPLASGGLQMEQGLVTFFKERGNKLAGRKVELHTADTAGNPAQARTKTQELVERLNVHCMIGPLAAFEALAIDDYIRSSQDADPHRRRRRGHDPAQGQSVAGASELDLGAAEPSDRPTTPRRT